MRRTLKIFKAQGVDGEVARADLIDDLIDFRIDLPQTADRKDIEKYLKKCEDVHRKG